MVLVANDKKKLDANTWIADSGASTYMYNSLEGMFDLDDTNLFILVGDGKSMSTAKVEKFRGHIVDLEGNSMAIVLTNVSHVLELMVDFFTNCSHGKSLFHCRDQEWD